MSNMDRKTQLRKLSKFVLYGIFAISVVALVLADIWKDIQMWKFLLGK